MRLAVSGVTFSGPRASAGAHSTWRPAPRSTVAVRPQPAPADALGPLKVTPDTASRMSVLYEQHRQGRLTAEAFCREAWSVLAFREYRHPRYGWSLSYPAAWVIEQARPDVVKLRSPRGTPLELEAVVEVRTQSPVPAHIRSADELAAELAPTYERAARERVLPIMWRSRSAIRLRNDLPAYDTINDLGTLQQGRSRKVYLVVGRDAYVLDTEAAFAGVSSAGAQVRAGTTRKP